MRQFSLLLMAAFGVVSCSEICVDLPKSNPSLPQVAEMMSKIYLTKDNVDEVHKAVERSLANGYDEEYMMKNLYLNPGTGVGDEIPSTKASESAYSDPIRNKIEAEYMELLSDSDIQIYWPYSEDWDGESLPVITYDPGTRSLTNIGYEIVAGEDGQTKVEEIIVDEDVARSRPVWVINRNDDSAYKTLEQRRREDPSWSEGGTVIVRSTTDDVKTLILKDFTMKRNYDSWFGGASEFFVKCGAVENFTASTEAELQLYLPSITDFLVVVKRRDLGKAVPFNAILVSEMTPQLEELAFMVTEDDGGTSTSWECEAMVKVNSKSYGLTLDLPFKTRDDIVWRGSLSTAFLEKYIGKPQHFGDVDITFDYL